MATSKKKKAARKPAAVSYVLCLRTCCADLTSHGGFQWPKSGRVQCKDWSPRAECGNGLHGLLWGETNDASLLDWSESAKWLVVRVRVDEIVKIDDAKVKFPRGEVVHVGDRVSATAYLLENGGRGYRVTAGTATAGYRGTATAGYRGTATAGDSGTATAGDRGTATAGDSGTATAGDRGTATAGDSGTATAGDRGTATAGDRGTATAGDSGTATAGYRGTATAGDGGTATAGDRGTATAGDRGTATAGDSGTATAGDSGTATAGDRGTATAGYSGTVAVTWYDATKARYRIAIAEIGENGFEPNVPYRVIDGRLVKVPEAEWTEAQRTRLTKAGA